MADIAKCKLVTSKGVFSSGQELPSLPSAERKAIFDAGGIDGLPAKKADTKAISAAKKSVADAEAAVSAAENDADKQAAEALLAEAKQNLEDLED